MRKVLLLLLISIVVFTCSITSFATTEVDNSVIYFEDGSYIETVINIYDEDFSAFATKTKTGDKVISYKTSDGEVKWDATVKGTFTYTGSSATCTAASITYNIYDDAWKMTEATASKSSNKAVGNVTAKKYVLGLPIKTIEQSVTLTCSASGVLS